VQINDDDDDISCTKYSKYGTKTTGPDNFADQKYYATLLFVITLDIVKPPYPSSQLLYCSLEPLLKID